MQNINPYIRAHQKSVALWQSAVTQVVRIELEAAHDTVTQTMILEHPLMKVTNHYVSIRNNQPDFLFDNADQSDETLKDINTIHSLIKTVTNREDIAVSDDSIWPFTDDDFKWKNCLEVYKNSILAYAGVSAYRPPSSPNSTNEIISWKIPDNGKVAIIGDWGTGLNDAKSLLEDIIHNHTPSAIIHLGDIYYSGTTEECTNSFFNIINNSTIPIFCIPGNHEYFSLGHPFISLLSDLNRSIPTAGQQSTFFCLRTEDDGWQFIAMDTGVGDQNPGHAYDSFYAGPDLNSAEAEWHKNRIDEFNGPSILLSHHQLFSANIKINGFLSSQRHNEYLNVNLYNNFNSYFGTKIGAWLWGHEHNFVIYQNQMLDLAKGRLVGCSAYEETESNKPYKQNNSIYKYFYDPSTNNPIQVDISKYSTGSQKYYNHAYAIIDFSVRKFPEDSVEISYYQFPSFYPNTTDKLNSTLLYSELISRPLPGPMPIALPGNVAAVKVALGSFQRNFTVLFVLDLNNNSYANSNISKDWAINISNAPLFLDITYGTAYIHKQPAGTDFIIGRSTDNSLYTRVRGKDSWELKPGTVNNCNYVTVGYERFSSYTESIEPIGDLFVFFISTVGQLMVVPVTATLNYDFTWSTPSLLSSSNFYFIKVVACNMFYGRNGNGRDSVLLLFALDFSIDSNGNVNSNIWRIDKQPGGAWGGFTNISSNLPSIKHIETGYLLTMTKGISQKRYTVLFAIDYEHRLWYNEFNGYEWTGWTGDKFANTPKISFITCGYTYYYKDHGPILGHLEVFAIGLDGTLYHNSYGDTWNTWVANFDDAPKVTTLTTGNLFYDYYPRPDGNIYTTEVFAVGVDGNLYKNYFSDYSWHGWNNPI